MTWCRSEKPILGFHSFAEFNAYVTFVMLGMSIMMVVSAITSAPDFVTKYYEYATGIPDVECEKPYFWNNANTFYNVGTYIMQLICEPMALAPMVRKIPLQVRLYTGLVIMLLEMLLLIIIPSATIPSQDGAIAVLMVVSVMGGFSKALVDSTTNALVGPFPTKFMNGSQWGLTVVALFMSVVQCILKASMGSGFQDGLNQSRIYLSIGMAIQLIALLELTIMPLNPFAQKYSAEYRVMAKAKRGGESAGHTPLSDDEARELSDSNPVATSTADNTPLRRDDEAVAGGSAAHRDAGANNSDVSAREALGGDGRAATTTTTTAASGGTNADRRRRSLGASGTAEGEVRLDDSTLHLKHDPLEVEPAGGEEGEEEDEGNGVRAVGEVTGTFLTASGDADKMVDADQKGNLTSADQMVRTSAIQVIKKVWPMLLCAFIVFFTSLLIFPGVFFKVSNGEWYGTIIVLLFNVGDFVSRILLMFRPLRPPPKMVIIGSFSRLIIIPLLVLCARGYIPGVALPYVLITLLGLSNGFFGTMAMIHCPRTPTLTTAGERSIAAIWAGIFLMLGLCFGSNLALAITLTWKEVER